MDSIAPVVYVCHLDVMQAVMPKKPLGPFRATLKPGTGSPSFPRGQWTVRRSDAALPPVGVQRIAMAAERQPTNLPAFVTRLIGRDVAVNEALDLIFANRVVTVTGTAGIGKTSLALEVARRVAGEFADGSWLIDLASLADPALVPAAVARVLDLTLRANLISAESIARIVGEQHIFLLLDNCEHVVRAVARLADTFVRLCSRITILATSREALHIDGEVVYRLAPLAIPETDADQPAVILGHSAVELFIERVRERNASFSPGAAELSVIATICRHLDGIPLAIEFAAARADALGTGLVAASLVDRFGFLTSGRRTAVPRHRTLLAALDWSYQLLSDAEQVMLRQLGVFPASFTLEAATAVAGGDIASLIMKSVVSFDGFGSSNRCRLLETIRSYALRKLAEHNENEAARRLHAQYFRDLFACCGGDAGWRLSPEELVVRTREFDNVRAALDWCFSPSGDVEIGKDLAAACSPVWLHSALVAECRDWCERASRIADSPDAPDERRRVRLRIGFGAALITTIGTAEQTKAALTGAIADAERLGDLDTAAVGLFRLTPMLSARGEYNEAWTAAERLARIADNSAETDIVVAADRTRGFLLLGSGRLAEARACLERVLRFPAPAEGERRLYWYHSDHRAVTRAMLARTLCLQGLAERARIEAEASLEDLPGQNRRLPVCRVTAFGMIRVALLNGNLAIAERAIARLIDVATHAGSPFWQVEGRFLFGMLLVASGDFAEGAAVLRETFATCQRAERRGAYSEFRGALAEALIGCGQLDEALAVAEDAVTNAFDEGDSLTWHIPELLRIKGEALFRKAANHSVGLAADCFRQGIQMARCQGALLWELRVALSFARLRLTQGRDDEAKRLLSSVHDRFTEGFETPHLRAAKALIEATPR
jgi:predicted ATPase